MRDFADFLAESLKQARFADARLPDNQNRLTLTSTRAVPAVAQEV
jgi:hypothetical protein